MKTQIVILFISMIMLQMFVQIEGGFWGSLWEGVKSVVGKRGLRNLDDLDDLDLDHLFDSDVSDADLRLLKQMFR
uniref:Amphipathic peptide CT1 n=1 Tax=Scorpiops tibetanus TaxID=500600 RepID=NDB48_SCOTI|nr:RecName: Full=Amphipathic peptide CT1; Short=StCT1; AltName: Full=Non-disulfide-bridged peptide 4.8; Short=NDBP-4.8; AltName: Full=Non-disulfide-bridged peptide 5.16; Short=NDBP-5.16; Flags: Precursor [Scorpiops tibetanus]